eukprot:scaffold99704_cov39-Phaeocystis_antarctica.AAC.2
MGGVALAMAAYLPSSLVGAVVSMNSASGLVVPLVGSDLLPQLGRQALRVLSCSTCSREESPNRTDSMSGCSMLHLPHPGDAASPRDAPRAAQAPDLRPRCRTRQR